MCVYKILGIGYMHEREHRQTESFTDLIDGRSTRVDGTSFDLMDPLQAGYKKSLLRRLPDLD